MLPPAPPRLSMMNGCFRASERSLAIGRAAMSDGPPAGHGTTMLTGFAGYPCASAAADTAASAVAPRSIVTKREAVLMASPGTRAGDRDIEPRTRDDTAATPRRCVVRS